MINICMLKLQDEQLVLKGRKIQDFHFLESENDQQIILKCEEARNKKSIYFLDFKNNKLINCFVAKNKKEPTELKKIRKPIFIPKGVKYKVGNRIICGTKSVIKYEGQTFEVELKEI